LLLLFIILNFLAPKNVYVTFPYLRARASFSLSFDAGPAKPAISVFRWAEAASFLVVGKLFRQVGTSVGAAWLPLISVLSPKPSTTFFPTK
jgi:hypothetical protein